MKVYFLAATVGLILPLPGVDALAVGGLGRKTALMVGGFLAVTPDVQARELEDETTGDARERKLPPKADPVTTTPVPTTQVFLKPVFNSGNYSHPQAVNITEFKWLLVENNVGNYEGTLENPPLECNPDLTVNPNYPDGCDWPSIRSIKATAPIYGSGDHTEWDSDTSLELPEGKYMATIMAEGYRLCGAYFEVPGGPETVVAVCQEHPLPLGTIRMFIFEDSKPCNGQYDPGERPLFDFGIGVNDIEGPITEDYYGNSVSF